LENIVEIRLDPPNIGELLAGSDIYLSTSRFEGTSNSIMEAMNHSLPVVATDVGDNGVLIAEGETGYLCGIGDWMALSDRLKTLIAEHRTIAMGAASRHRLETLFSGAKFAESYLKLI